MGLGCQPPAPATADTSDSELVAINGLTMTNGLQMTNGLSGNGLAAQALVVNPLSSTGLKPSSYLMNSASGRTTLAYLIGCALPLGHFITKADLTGAKYTFAGAIGLTPGWENGVCSGDCQRWNSACLMAHVNTAGIHVPIWLVGRNVHLGWGQLALFPNQEGTFFGNIFTTNEAGHTDAYYCEGFGFKQVDRRRAHRIQSGRRALSGSVRQRLLQHQRLHAVRHQDQRRVRWLQGLQHG